MIIKVFVHKICPFESHKFFSRPTLLKLHNLVEQIESFPTPHRSWSCVDEKLSFRLYAQLHVVERKFSVSMPKVSKAVSLFVLRPILPKLHIWSALMESFLTTYGSWSYVEEKLGFTALGGFAYEDYFQSNRISCIGFQKQIILAHRNWIKNLPRQIVRACIRFGDSRCRDVETHSGYTDTHTDIHITE